MLTGQQNRKGRQKKDRKVTCCCVFRPLCYTTLKNAFRLPRKDASLPWLATTKLFTSIDLAAGFCQVPIEKTDNLKVAFACELGLFEKKLMPFGLCNCIVTFQSIGEKSSTVYCQEKLMPVISYLFDVLIATETVEALLLLWREVFECLRNAGLKVGLLKVHLLSPKPSTWDESLLKTECFGIPEQ